MSARGGRDRGERKNYSEIEVPENDPMFLLPGGKRMRVEPPPAADGSDDEEFDHVMNKKAQLTVTGKSGPRKKRKDRQEELSAAAAARNVLEEYTFKPESTPDGMPAIERVLRRRPSRPWLAGGDAKYRRADESPENAAVAQVRCPLATAAPTPARRAIDRDVLPRTRVSDNGLNNLFC